MGAGGLGGAVSYEEVLSSGVSDNEPTCCRSRCHQLGARSQQLFHIQNIIFGDLTFPDFFPIEKFKIMAQIIIIPFFFGGASANYGGTTEP